MSESKESALLDKIPEIPELPSDDVLRALAYPCPGCQMNFYDIKYGVPIAWNSDDCYVEGGNPDQKMQNAFSGTPVELIPEGAGASELEETYENVPVTIDKMNWMGARWVKDSMRGRKTPGIETEEEGEGDEEAGEDKEESADASDTIEPIGPGSSASQ